MTLTASGEAMRARAELALRRRYGVLLDRSKRRALTEWEHAELDGLGWALNELLGLEAALNPSPGQTSGAAIAGGTTRGQ